MNIEEFKQKKEEFKRLHRGCYIDEDDDSIYAYDAYDPVVDCHLIGQLKNELAHETIKIQDKIMYLCDVDLVYNKDEKDLDIYYKDSEHCTILTILDTQCLPIYFNNKDYLVYISVGRVDNVTKVLLFAYKACVESLYIDDLEV